LPLFAVFLPLNLMAQDAAALRKERDKLNERGLWREAVDHYKKLLPISDTESGVISTMPSGAARIERMEGIRPTRRASRRQPTPENSGPAHQHAAMATMGHRTPAA
jgi:hypothetical protein